MRTIEHIARQWELLGVTLCNFCEFPLMEEESKHQCLANQDGCGCGEECSLKEDKCGCSQCWG
jgi:hypothetical protein